tara:strand:+ start:404 stop:625 length:222 start_codon:yes stop_codon:yes gene_type:complete
MKRPQKRWLIGKTIADVTWNTFEGLDGRQADEPTIVFEDGSRIYIIGAEMESHPGVFVGYIKPYRTDFGSDAS